MAQNEEVYFVHSKIRGYHVYKDLWEASIGEKLTCQKELNNVHDPYCVGVIRRGLTVGHVPREISAVCSLFLDRCGTITCEVIGSRQYSDDLPRGGLEIPCKLSFSGPAKYLGKVRKLVESAIASKLDTWCVNRAEKQSNHVMELDSDVEAGDPSEAIWLEFESSRLTLSDRVVLRDGGRLNDRHVNFAQKLLKMQFPCVDGFRLTLQQSKEQPKIGEGIQIIHCRGDHWVVAASLGCKEDEVYVFDSVYGTVDDDTRSIILNLFGPERANITMVKMQQQKGPDDCGLFTIAVATALVHSVDLCTFKQDEMRIHALACFEDKLLCVFPALQ